MLYKEIPFVRFTLPLVAGILLRYYTGYILPYYVLIPLIIALILANSFSDDRLKSLFYGFVLNLFLLISGYLLYSQKYNIVNNTEAPPGIYTVRVDKKPVPREKSLKVPSSIMVPSSRGKYRAGAKIMLYFPPESEVHLIRPGTLLELKLSPLRIQDFDTLDNFDYSRYMLHLSYKFYSFADNYTSTGEYSPGIKQRSASFQHRLMAKYSSLLNDPQSLAIVSALTLGYKDQLDEEIREKFSGAGISHIMAVSGLHVGIIMLIISGLLKMLQLRSHPVKLLITILSVWAFAHISGLSPSVTRASLMFSFVFAGKYAGRHVNPLNSLFASAFILLVINPFILFSVSFQLSYSAVLAILLFYRKMDGLLNFSGLLLSKLWSLVSVTLLAQAGTLPFVLYYFRSVPMLSVFTNILAIPLASLIIITGLLLLTIPSSVIISDILATLLTIETKLLYSIADWISSI